MAEKPKFGPRKPIGIKIQGKIKPPAGKPKITLASGLSEQAIRVFELAREQHLAMINQARQLATD